MIALGPLFVHIGHRVQDPGVIHFTVTLLPPWPLSNPAEEPKNVVAAHHYHAAFRRREELHATKPPPNR
jgi:hypothetical protein